MILEQERASVLSSGKTHAVLGRVYQQQGRPKDAETSYMEAIRMEPGTIEPWIDLAELKAQQGELSQAIRAYQSALTMSQPHDSWVPDVRHKLKKLKAQERSAPATQPN